MVVTVDFNVTDLPKFAFANDAITGFDKMRRAAALRTDLNGTVIFASRLQHGLAFGDIDTDWFLDENVGTSFDGIDHW